MGELLQIDFLYSTNSQVYLKSFLQPEQESIQEGLLTALRERYPYYKISHID